VVTLCKCGHSVYDHGLFGCDCCGCSRDTQLSDRLIASDRIRKTMAQLAAAEAEQKLQPVTIQPAVERSA
jgi:hypothetical protein